MALFVPRPIVLVAALSLLASPVRAQRPALSGEKAQVADSVKADLARLSTLQSAHHARTRVYAADARDLNFTPRSGAQINIAYASMNAWAANATHPVLSPIACFIIFSSAEPTGPAAEPFCQEGRPGTVAPAGAPTAAPPTRPPPTQPARPAAAAPTGTAPTTATPPTVSTTPAQAAPTTRPQAAAPSAPPTAAARPPEVGMTPVAPTTPLREPAAAAPQGDAARPVRTLDVVGDRIPFAARAGTREVDVAGAAAPSATENATPQQFSQHLAEFAQQATALSVTQTGELEAVVRDPYESTAEFEARRAAAVAAAERREREFFQQNSRTFVVAMPVRQVRYDPDREVLEFTVDGVGLPMTRVEGDQVLVLQCYSRPVFWCGTETGMIYDAGDLWRVPRATARQHDVLRNPLTLNARFAVGRRQDRTLAISLLSMDLQARGQSVQRWDGAAR
jgi:hypothetical protein